MAKTIDSIPVIERYRFIDDQLQRNQHPTREQLLNRLNRSYEVLRFNKKKVSKQTLDEDIEFMKNILGAPIEYKRAIPGYVYTKEYTLNYVVPASEEEKKYIRFAIDLLKQKKFNSILPFFDTALQKTLFGFTLFVENESLDQNFIDLQNDEAFNGLNNAGTDWLREIYDAIIEKEVLEIEYKRFENNKTTKHIISAYLIKEYNSKFYVIGHSNITDDFVILAFDRILKIHKTKKKYIKPKKNFNVKNHFSQYYGISSPYGKYPVLITLEVSNSYLPYIESRPIHKTQIIGEKNKKTNTTNVEINCFLSRDLESKLLSFGENVTVKKPVLLVEKIKKRLLEINANYK
jgi:predicted DNA-binding transcriptional regulator YafY